VAAGSRTVRGKRVMGALSSRVTGVFGIVGHAHPRRRRRSDAMFDGHVVRLLDATVALVNDLTDGTRQGRPYTAPQGARLPRAVHDALPPSPDRTGVPPEHAAYLARAAHRMRAVFEAVDAGDLDRAARLANDLLRGTGARPQLDRAPGEPWQLHFHGSDDSLSVGWSAGCATALALAIGSDLAGRLGVCAAPECDRVYVDGSRNAARHFCSPPCRSRVKAAAYRARKAAALTRS
jgi:predicted RNA-binding Zn ribbon-like protein